MVVVLHSLHQLLDLFVVGHDLVVDDLADAELVLDDVLGEVCVG